ncbi:hypothetical protein BDP27DRAFT_1327666 [Rhodocollybia butyracea]|uniref:Uncharacterized protein n=1 Tax=Rhodocollybia butyracea TaxID=206335 RepID=A0A9P5U6M0_9AGAR|nr:hypothetical protein BDP27DRAFT_1327666 [Rhodocollybia butyracea]
MLYCHVSHTPPHANLLLQITHILIPNAMKTNNPLFTVYEWILGMDYLSLCKHSRLFLMPLMNSIHCRLDDSLFVILPRSLSLLGKMMLYFSAVQTRGNNYENMWALIRNRNFPGLEDVFDDGNIYPYFLVPHPFAHDEVREGLAYPGTFYSHTSPFAVLLNAFRTLHVWSTNRNGSRGYNAPTCPSEELLAVALRALSLPEEEVTKILHAVERIYEIIAMLISQLETEGPTWFDTKKPSDDGPKGSTRRGRGGNNHGGAHHLNPTQLQSCIEKNGLSGLGFTGGKGASNLMHEP